MDLHRTLLKDVILPKVKSVYVVDYYEGVRGLLESREEIPYKSIFANPRFRSKTEIIWSSDVFDSEPQRLSELKGDEKEYYSHLLYKQIQSVRELVDTLKTEEGGVPLSELLSRVISNIEDKSVYCGENQIVIVNWGLIPRQADIEGACIFRSGNFIGNWEQAHRIDPRETTPESTDTESNLSEDEETSHTEETENRIEEPIESSNPEASASSDIENHDSVDEEKGTIESEIENDKVKSEDKVIEESTEDYTSEKNPKEDKAVNPQREEKKKETKQESYNKKTEKYNWKKFFKDTLNGLIFLFRKLWWLLLAILLIILSLFLFKDCQGPIQKVNPFYNPLPENPVIMPIEENGVVMSEDGLYKVSNNRLNIILEKESDNTMLEWAKAFKNHYSSSDYEIVYYNKNLCTLQIKVPVDKRLEVKHELNQILDGFSFDVFEESVYQGDFSANDPALKDRKASWYLDAIGAYTAWDMTQGSEDVVVAVVDNGFDLSHPEFADKIVSPYNVLTQNADIRPINTKDGVNAHGTHVAATAVGKSNNGSGLLGIAPNCKLMPVQVGNDNPDGSMSNTAIIEGVLYAINNGADIVNVSLGMYAPDEVKGMSESEQLNYISNSFKEEEEMWEKVFDKAKERDCIIVFAAGNDNIISGIDPKKRNPNTVRVSAVDPKKAKTGFSNFGRYPSLNRDYSTVSAPGVAIYSAAPKGQYQYMQGTSMAAPIVSGAIALMKSANHNLTSEEAISILQETGKTIDPAIGPMINIGQAVNIAMGNTPNFDCEKIRAEVQRLQARIDSLSRICPGSVEPADTLKYNDVIEDPRSLDGTWKSTTELVNTSDQSPIVLYMTFKKLKGQLTIVNKDLSFTAPLQASVDDKKIHITQSGPAINTNTNTSFVPYTYACSADRKGNLFCNAVSATNRVSFNLVRIK